MSERIIRHGKYTEVKCIDEPGAGGACHEYIITEETASMREANQPPPKILGKISFQNGAILESGVNGLQGEDLIAICIDRLQHFQAGKFACRENAIALTKFQEGLMWLESRTNRRTVAGTEGTHKPD